MPFESQAQRRLGYAAAKDPKVAKRTGFSQAAARKFVAHDKPGKLPARKSKRK